MTNEIKKCPNCGHQFKEGEEYCPNCDLFVPIDEQTETENLIDPNEEKQFKTFKEKKNDNPAEPLFKHRAKSVSETNEAEDSIYEQDTQSVEIEETEPTSEETYIEASELEPMESTQSEAIDAEIDELLYEKDEVFDDAPIIEANEKEPEVRTPTPNNKKSNKNKYIIGAVVIVALIAGGSYVYSNSQKKAAEKDRLELVATTEKDIDSLYTSDEKVFLKDGITQADIDNAEKAVNKLKTKDGYDELKEEFDTAQDKFNKQQSINNLFKTPVISGKDLTKDTYVKNSDAITLNKIGEEKDGFDILYNEAITEAQTQKDALKSVEEKVAVVFKDDDVVKAATRDQYEAAQTAINSLKDENMKETLTTSLKKVDTVLVAAEKKKEAEEAAAEQERLAAIEAENQAAAAATAATNNNNNNSSSSSSSSNNSGSTGLMGNREDTVKDFSDPAWAWNPGIQNEVMTEVIRRGYVVEGGYSLVPKYVENGEGYYDLYATTNSKIFPNSKPQEFPLYVVTINVKTGSFKGNGPN